jgi:hypothetical protein
MLVNGQYSVWFKTSSGGGTGVVMLIDGKVSGGDTVLSYNGHCEQMGDQFKATIATKRHSPGQPSVFGIDDVDIALIGTSNGGPTASCAGTVKQAPGETFEATLVRMAD